MCGSLKSSKTTEWSDLNVDPTDAQKSGEFAASGMI
jgi:hypothetical protein